MKLVQLNVERNKHSDRVVPFLESQHPDVICLQEVMEDTIHRFAADLGLYVTFARMARLYGFESDVEGQWLGVGLLTRMEHRVRGIHQYVGPENVSECFTKGTHDHNDDMNRLARKLIVADCGPPDGAPITIATTHFTWSEQGLPSVEQRTHIVRLRHLLKHYEEYILVGDMNIPRGTGLFNELANGLTDNVPAATMTTLDQELHRKPGLMYVVDHLLTTAGYRAEHVRVVSGVSDHCALVADITPVR
jgi:endonuclease/exonuclease/phosphatase family metal-dependent hydrolase